MSLTMREWLAAREPAPPAALAGRLAAHADGTMEREPFDPAALCLTSAERLLGDLLDAGSVSRGSALDLLAADALVTYAFEAAADEPDRIEERARRAIARIAAFADGSPPAEQ